MEVKINCFLKTCKPCQALPKLRAHCLAVSGDLDKRLLPRISALGETSARLFPDMKPFSCRAAEPSLSNTSCWLLIMKAQRPPSQALSTAADPGSLFRLLWRRMSDLCILVRNYLDTRYSIYRGLWKQNADSYQSPFIYQGLTNEFLGNLLPVIPEHWVLGTEAAGSQGGQKHACQGSCSALC